MKIYGCVTMLSCMLYHACLNVQQPWQDRASTVCIADEGDPAEELGGNTGSLSRGAYLCTTFNASHQLMPACTPRCASKPLRTGAGRGSSGAAQGRVGIGTQKVISRPFIHALMSWTCNSSGVATVTVSLLILSLQASFCCLVGPLIQPSGCVTSGTIPPMFHYADAW